MAHFGQWFTRSEVRAMEARRAAFEDSRRIITDLTKQGYNTTELIDAWMNASRAHRDVEFNNWLHSIL